MALLAKDFGISIGETIYRGGKKFFVQYFAQSGDEEQGAPSVILRDFSDSFRFSVHPHDLMRFNPHDRMNMRSFNIKSPSRWIGRDGRLASVLAVAQAEARYFPSVHVVHVHGSGLISYTDYKTWVTDFRKIEG